MSTVTQPVRTNITGILVHFLCIKRGDEYFSYSPYNNPMVKSLQAPFGEKINLQDASNLNPKVIVCTMELVSKHFVSHMPAIKTKQRPLICSFTYMYALFSSANTARAQYHCKARLPLNRDAHLYSKHASW